MRVSILVLDGALDSGLSAVLDILETANELARGLRGTNIYDLTLCGVRRAATTHHGFRVALERVRENSPPPDLVIVPSHGAKTVDAILVSFERPQVAEAAGIVRSWARGGARVAGACTAAFILAAAGVLDGKTATTTWWLASFFRERFPRVLLDESRMVVEAPGVITAGAAMAHIDLALWLVRQRSPSLARTTARYLISDERPSQAAYAIKDHHVHSDPIVDRFELWARKHIVDFSLVAAAQAVGASERTLERRLQTVVGKSPRAYVQELRVEMAVHLLRTTKDSLDEIASAVGYGDGVTLRTLIRKKTGYGIREIRGR